MENTRLNIGRGIMKRFIMLTLMIWGMIVLTACANEVMVNFNSNGGNVVTSIYVDEKTQITMPSDPSKEGYTFSGWYCDQELTIDCSENVKHSTDITLYAKWEINHYSVSFISYDDIVVQEELFDYEMDLSSVVAPENPTREGHVFDGWENQVPAVMGTENITITAKWIELSVLYYLNNGAIMITKYTGDNPNVIIPETINGYPVRKIYKNAFEDMDLVSVTLPSTLKSIGYKAFYKNNLTNVVFPEGLITIGDSAFANNEISSIVLPSTLKSIGEKAFESNEITELELPEGLTSIGALAFMENQLEIVNLPSSLISLGYGAFNQNFTLTEYIIADGNINFKYTNNTLFSSDGKIIYDYVYDGVEIDYVVPHGVTIIGNYAFSGNEEHQFRPLSSVTLPPTLKEIRVGAFLLNDLTTIVIPEGVVSIGSGAFLLNSLTTISLPTSLVKIENFAFAINPLTKVLIPANVQIIESSAFYLNPIISLTILGDETRFNDDWESIGFPENLMPTVE